MRPDLLACAVAEERTVAGGDEERKEGENRRCRRGYWWAGSAGAGECHLKEEATVERVRRLLL